MPALHPSVAAGKSLRAVFAAAVLALLSPRGAAALSPDQKYYYEDILTPFFRLDPVDGTIYRSVRPGAVRSSFPAAKPRDAFRVFLLGGSTTGGYNGPDDLGRALALALPEREVEVINCGMSGYDATREGLVEREILGYAPDLIVFMTGHNEFFIRNAPPVAPWVLRLHDLFGRWSWTRALERLAAGGSGGATDDRARLAGFDRTFRGNLRAAVGRGVRVIACLPPVNYSDDPPVADPPWASPAFMSGWVPFLRGDAGRARVLWEKGLTSAAPEDASARSFLLFSLGRAAQRLGRTAQAQDFFDRSLAAENPAHVCAKPCRDAIAAAARAEGALPVDLDAAFRRFDAPRVPGLDLFGDEIHWAPRVHAVVSAAVVSALARDAAFAGLPWDRAALREVEQDWLTRAKTPGPAARAAEIDNLVFYAGHAIAAADGFSWQAATWLEYLAETAPAVVDGPEAFERAYREADARRSAKVWRSDESEKLRRAPLLWHLAEMRLRRGESRRAEALLTEALRLDPARRLIRVDLALAQALDGRAARARETLRGAPNKEAAATARALGFQD